MVGQPAAGGAQHRVGHGQPCTRATQADGSAISVRVGNVSGDVQMALNDAIPTCCTTASTNAAPLTYWASYMSIPSNARSSRSIGPFDRRRRSLKDALIAATDGTTAGPTASIT